MESKYSYAKNALWGWIFNYYNISIPKIPVCTDKGHCSPYDALAFSFLNPAYDTLWIGARSTGKSLSFALLNSLDCLAFDGCETLSAGAIEEQSKRVYKYFLEFSHLPCWQAFFDPTETRKTMIKFKNGSQTSIVPATMEQFNGPHPDKLFIDELELIPASVMEEGVYMVRGTKRIPGQTIFTTSRKFPWGPAEKMMRQIDEGKSEITLFTWCVFDALERCEETSCEPCKRRISNDGRRFYDICKLRPGREGEHSNGKDIMRAKIPDGHFPLKQLWKVWQDVNTDPKKFDSQVLSLSPSRDALVYPMLEPRVHVKAPDWLQERLKEIPRLVVHAAIDWGFVDPTCILFFVIYGGHIYILDEIYEAGLMPMELKEKVEWKVRSNGWVMGECVVDPSRKDAVEMFIRNGFDVHEADNRIDLGISETQAALRYSPAVGDVPGIEPVIYFSEKCVNSWKDCVEYHWQTKKPEELSENMRKKPDIHQSDHGADCLRYIVMQNLHSAVTETVTPMRHIEYEDEGFSVNEPGWNF